MLSIGILCLIFGAIMSSKQLTLLSDTLETNYQIHFKLLASRMIIFKVQCLNNYSVNR